MWEILILLSLTTGLSYSSVYHTFDGTELSADKLDLYKDEAVEYCTKSVEDCNAADYRRLDGTCNNIKEKSRGGTFGPLRRLLPASYDNGSGIRKAKSGKPLPNARVVRTSMLFDGRVSNKKYTTLVTNIINFMASDVLQPLDAEKYIGSTQSCCSVEGKANALCDPISIPDDDPVFRFTGYRCMNFTRSPTYQTKGCLGNDTNPEITNKATPAFDLSNIYGVKNDLSKYRKLEKGLLKTEELKGRSWPPKIEDPAQANAYCIQNNGDANRCHETPSRSSNEEIGTNLFTIWYWRLHNTVATKLSKLNACWDDKKLFNTARDITVAFSQQVYFYELLPTLFDHQSLTSDGIISPESGFRATYDDNLYPQVSYEYVFAQRLIHTIQEGMLKLYDHEGKYVRSFPAVNLTYGTGYLASGDNLDLITQGSFRQACAEFDNVIDPDYAERAFGSVQEIADIATIDIAEGRDLGLQSYVAYKQKISNENITSWEDLAQVLKPGQAERLQSIYDDVEDIDLIVGLWAEKPMHGSDFPSTFYSIIADDLKTYVKSDRHWYEREKRPNAFTAEQLAVLRKASVASLLCTVGDKVTKIQPNAFLKAGAGNEMVACSEIPQLDVHPWKFKCPKPTPPPPPPHNAPPPHHAPPPPSHHAPAPAPAPKKKKENIFSKAWDKVKHIGG